MELHGRQVEMLRDLSFLIATASSTCRPCTHSVTTLLLAIADPQPNVLKQESTIFSSPSTLICKFMTSPHAGAPTSPVPTLMSLLSAIKGDRSKCYLRKVSYAIKR